MRWWRVASHHSQHTYYWWSCAMSRCRRKLF